jgi:hypothetical protein
MLDRVNLTLWVWFCESAIRQGEDMATDQTLEALLQEGERDLGIGILSVCSTLNQEIEFSLQNFGTFLQGEQTMFALLDQNLVQFLERYAQDTENDIPPPHPDNYRSVTALRQMLRSLKPNNPRSNENIDKVLGLMENETAKFAKNVQPYSEPSLVIIRP